MWGDFWSWITHNSAAIQTICIVMSAIAAFIVIWHNGKIGRRQATINMVMTTFFDSDHGDSYQRFKDLMLSIEESAVDISDFAEERHDNKEGRSIILKTANHYEMVSLGIKTKVFDEKFYKFWFFTQFTKDFGKLKPFIDKTRSDDANEAYFCEFESMATRWNRKKHPVKHPARLKQVYWLLRGQSEKVARASRAVDKN